MAQALSCDLCQNEVAVLMQTNIGNGDVIAIGDSCLLPFTLTVAGEILEGMPAEVASTFGDALAPVVAKLSGAISDGAAAADPDAPPDALEAAAMAPAEGAADDEAADLARHATDAPAAAETAF